MWAMLTSHDATRARIFDLSRIPCLLVGDSAAQAVFGHKSTLPLYHGRDDSPGQGGGGQLRAGPGHRRHTLRHLPGVSGLAKRDQIHKGGWGEARRRPLAGRPHPAPSDGPRRLHAPERALPERLQDPGAQRDRHQGTAGRRQGPGGGRRLR